MALVAVAQPDDERAPNRRQRRASRMERHRADSLKRDARVNRALIPSRLRYLRDHLDLDGIGVVTVNRRRNGDLVILDGQHRVETLIALGMGEWEVDCHVYEDLSLSEEAGQFRMLNNSRKPTPFDDFDKGVMQMDPECVAIDDIVEHAGLKVGNQARNGYVKAINALRVMYRGPNGPWVLGAALDVVTTAWGRKIDAVDGNVLSGVGLVLAKYGEVIELDVLARKLAKRPGGPLALLGDARGLHRLRNTTVASALGQIVIDTYNKGRREALPAL